MAMCQRSVMWVVFWSMIVIACCNPINPHRPGNMSNKGKQKQYLKKFGYIKNNGAQVTDAVFNSAMKKYQKQWGLPETGEMNDETQALMETPRCGCPDVIDDDSDDSRVKRYTLHRLGGWSKTDLTYRIVNSTSELSKSVSDDALRRAIEEWAKYTPLTFTEVTSGEDITIFFVSYSHADGSSFDGPGRVLAHAFFPAYGGDAHFDGDENWTLNDDRGDGIDLFVVGVHEFGHSLGLEHSRVSGAIMAPYYEYPSSIQADDIAGIQAIYGVKEDTTTTKLPPTSLTTTQPTTTSTPSQTTPSNTCVYNSMDAITSDKSGNIFVFHGSTYTLIDDTGIVEGFPKEIKSDFPELNGAVDAAVYLPKLLRDKCLTKKGTWRCNAVQRSEEVFLFSGTTYYRYNTGYLQGGRIKKNDRGSISSKFGLPSGITLDAAFTYDGSDIYFVNQDSLWKVQRKTNTIENGYPKSLSQDLVYGLPTPINDVFSVQTTSAYYNYFFLDNTYYRTTNGANNFDDGEEESYPRSIFDWWCQNNL